MTPKEIKSELISLAAQMARGQNMPSDFLEDWPVTKKTTRLMKQTIVARCERAQEQSREWATKIRRLADTL